MGFVTRVSAAPARDARWNSSCYDTALRGRTVLWPIRCIHITEKERVRKRERERKQVCMWTAAISKLPVPPQYTVTYRATSAHSVAACTTTWSIERIVGLTVTCSPRQREEFIGWMSLLGPPWTCPGSIIGFNRLPIILWSALPAFRHEARGPTV